MQSAPAPGEHGHQQTGDLLNERYELGAVIGTGGMGSVRRAFDTRLGRPVAIKILRGDRVGDDGARARLEAEARLAAGIDHPNIASIYDYDEDRASAHRDPFIVMQLVEGVALGRVLNDERCLPEASVRTLLAGVGEALSASHAAGVIHRDIKPSNIVLAPDGSPVLVDFGIATSASIEPLTETGVIVGTLEYLSPEQARNLPASGASDVYSLGVVATQCLTGCSPFKRESAIETALAHVSDDLPALPVEVSPALARLVRSMTDKDPASRPPPDVVVETARSAVTLDDLRRRPGGLFREWRPQHPRLVVYASVCLAVLLLIGSAITALALRGGGAETMPDVIGLSATRASARLEDAGASVKQVSVDRATARAGTVVGQSVEPGAPLAKDTVVTIEVATGRMKVEASKLEGRTIAEARRSLEKLGFVVAVTSVPSSRPAGTVLALDRSGRLPIGATITLSVSEGGAKVITSRTEGSTSHPNKGPGNNNGRRK